MKDCDDASTQGLSLPCCRTEEEKTEEIQHDPQFYAISHFMDILRPHTDSCFNCLRKFRRLTEMLERYRVHPLPKEVLETFEVCSLEDHFKKNPEKNSFKCAICQEEYEKTAEKAETEESELNLTTPIMDLGCHQFCEECIRPWLKRSKRCPLCREEKKKKKKRKASNAASEIDKKSKSASSGD